jgi:hypothetical protein
MNTPCKELQHITILKLLRIVIIQDEKNSSKCSVFYLQRRGSIIWAVVNSLKNCLLVQRKTVRPIAGWHAITSRSPCTDNSLVLCYCWHPCTLSSVIIEDSIEYMDGFNNMELVVTMIIICLVDCFSNILLVVISFEHWSWNSWYFWWKVNEI